MGAFVWLAGGYGHIIYNICWFPGIVLVACSYAAVQDDSRVPPWFVVPLSLYFVSYLTSLLSLRVLPTMQAELTVRGITVARVVYPHWPGPNPLVPAL
jgi:hypothetical protein